MPTVTAEVGVTEQIGDIFAVPEGSVLIHACNCQGMWGSGVAAAFKQKFPAAYRVYHEHCTIPGSTHVKKLLVGTCLLIAPQDADLARGSGRYWIACLMTSLDVGRRIDKPDAILANTRAALRQLRDRLDAAKAAGPPGLSFDGKLYTVRLNGKAFRTPWPLTRRVLENSLLRVTVLNNVDVMDERERRNVLDEMERDGFDVERVREVRVRLQSFPTDSGAVKRKKSKQRSDDAGEEERAAAEEDEGDKKRKTKRARKSTEDAV